jgi:MoxR-like ATPase/uncharacterized protein (DUF2461 family)
VTTHAYGLRRSVAIAGARERFLNRQFLDATPAPVMAAVLSEFYHAVVAWPLADELLARKASLVRHAINHLLHNTDPLPVKFARCVEASGAYHIVGLGPDFWSALAQALDPLLAPAWVPDVRAGLARLEMHDSRSEAAADVYADLCAQYARIRKHQPTWSAGQIDWFLANVAHLRGREWGTVPNPHSDWPGRIRQARNQRPLRATVKTHGRQHALAKADLEVALRHGDLARLVPALAALDPVGALRLPTQRPGLLGRLVEWVQRLWLADDVYAELTAFWQAEPLPGAGLWLPAVVLHIRAATQFALWDDASRAGLRQVCAAARADLPPAESYRLFNLAADWLVQQQRVHPLEVPGILAAWAPTEASAGLGFTGFCADTFCFLRELQANNQRSFMERARARYRFAVRAPLAELCRELARRYVEPVLHQGYGWELETAPRSGAALSSITKNDFGKSVPYQTALWITFFRTSAQDKRAEVQLYVRLDATGVQFGVHMGAHARAAGKQLRHNLQTHADALLHALHARGALTQCRFGVAPDLTAARRVTEASDLRAWGTHKTLAAGVHVAADDPVLRTDELVGAILLTFDRLLPVFVWAAEADPVSAWRTPGGAGPGGCSPTDFVRLTHLRPSWLERTLQLLELKKQLILQGVPGTGKTHVARTLARLLTRDRPDAVRLVQFHPAYSYEEFVEGIKVRSVEVAGRHETTYPVEDGLLVQFAAQAAERPNEPFVLLIDEINRGNLPRIFGELLYLLEYREQAVSLPTSRRLFRLPANLYLLGTMNAADRSVALVDQALRRRFSFVDMEPDPTVLAAWLETHPPVGGDEQIKRVVLLFEELNRRLVADLGPTCRVGHSYLMVPALDADKLEVIWTHHVLPLVREYCAGQPALVGKYTLDKLQAGPRKSTARNG